MGVTLFSVAICCFSILSRCDSNPAQYERNRRFGQLAHTVARASNAVKLPSVGLWLNASKSESCLVIATIDFVKSRSAQSWSKLVGYFGDHLAFIPIIGCSSLIVLKSKTTVLWVKIECNRQQREPSDLLQPSGKSNCSTIGALDGTICRRLSWVSWWCKSTSNDGALLLAGFRLSWWL